MTSAAGRIGGERTLLEEQFASQDLAALHELLNEVEQFTQASQCFLTELTDFGAASKVLRGVTLRLRSALAAKTPAEQALGATLLGRLHDVDVRLTDTERSYRDSSLRIAREALDDLQHLETVPQLITAGAEAICRLGFDRAIVSSLADSMWMTEAIHVDGDSDWADEILAAGRSAPQPVTAGLPEKDLVRLGKPIAVYDVQHKIIDQSKIHQAVASASRSRSYVAAAIAPGDGVVGFLHGDRFFHSGDVSEFDRDLLGLFGRGYSFALQRVLVLQELRSLQQQVQSFASGLVQASTTSIDEPSWARSATETPWLAHNTVRDLSLIPMVETNPDDRLTRREVEVLRLMANGDTNHRIARRLIISESTVKSHVKHILRKLGAANRAEAVARWHQGKKQGA